MTGVANSPPKVDRSEERIAWRPEFPSVIAVPYFIANVPMARLTGRMKHRLAAAM